MPNPYLRFLDTPDAKDLGAPVPSGGRVLPMRDSEGVFLVLHE